MTDIQTRDVPDLSPNLDLERRLADGEAAMTLAIIRWVHACCDVTHDRYAWYRAYWSRDTEQAESAADNLYDAAVKCAHEARTLAQLLDARDARQLAAIERESQGLDRLLARAQDAGYDEGFTAGLRDSARGEY